MSCMDCKYETVIDDIKNDVYGNNKKGIKEDVMVLKNDMAWIKKIGIGIVVLLAGNIATMITIYAIIFQRLK